MNARHRPSRSTGPALGGRSVLLLAILALQNAAFPAAAGPRRPMVIADQGSFMIGGTVMTAPGRFDPKKPNDPAGQTFHGDHLYAFYQVPAGARRLPIVFWHGTAQSAKTWETTPDGREGFQNIFLRRRYGVYLVDQPRRGDAARGTVPGTFTPTPDEQSWFDQFRVGVWPDYFPGVQFARDPETLNQYFRQLVPNVGPYDVQVVSDAGAALFDRIGPGVLFTHSRGGGPGWLIAVKNANVRAIVSFEPGSDFVFPEGRVPSPLPSSSGPLAAVGIAPDRFTRLTRIPIIIFYGDNIPDQPTEMPAQDSWRVRLAMARKWRDEVNRHGGDVTVVHLPEIGIRGNTHFPFSDLNNVQIADLVSAFLHRKGLDGPARHSCSPTSKPAGRACAGNQATTRARIRNAPGFVAKEDE